MEIPTHQLYNMKLCFMDCMTLHAVCLTGYTGLQVVPPGSQQKWGRGGWWFGPQGISKTFWLVKTRREVLLQLVGRGQGYCPLSYTAQDSPTPANSIPKPSVGPRFRLQPGVWPQGIWHWLSLYYHSVTFLRHPDGSLLTSFKCGVFYLNGVFSMQPTLISIF